MKTTITELDERHKPDVNAEYERVFAACDAKAEESFFLTDTQLLAKDIQEPEFIMDSFLTAGVTVLAGSPKTGKSWIALQAAVAKAAGRALWNERDREIPGDALYLALEDSDSRISNRRNIQSCGDPQPQNRLTYATNFRRMGQGGLHLLINWIVSVRDPKLIIIDTLAKFRPVNTNSQQSYSNDYEAITSLKRIADYFSIAVVAITHTRKSKADDILEEVSGTLGLTGAADTTLILKRERGVNDASLFITGRDVEEQNLALTQDRETMLWHSDGDYRPELNETASKVLRALPNADGPSDGLKPVEVAEATGINHSNVKQTLNRLYQRGEVDRHQGRYFIPADAPSGQERVTVSPSPEPQTQQCV